MRQRRFDSALAPFVLARLRASGLDTTALEREFLDPSAPGSVGLDDLGGLLERAAGLAGDELFGLHCAQSMSRGAYGLMEFGLRAAPTGRVAMEQLAAYGALINPLVRWSLETEGDEVSLHHRAPKKGGVGRQGNLFTVARVLRIAREMLGDDVTPTRVWFAHRERACPPELSAFLRAGQVVFGRASNGLAFAADTLARVPKGADVELNRALEAHGRGVLERCGDEADAYARTRAVVLELLPGGGATLESAARRLHVSPRTLQRRLGQLGVSFAELLAEVRRAQAERLLQGDATLAVVAEAVGYADAATFARAFRRWTGVTPGRFRSDLA